MHRFAAFILVFAVAVIPFGAVAADANGGWQSDVVGGYYGDC